MRVHLSTGGCVKLSLQRAKLKFYRNVMLPEMSSFCFEARARSVCSLLPTLLPIFYPPYLLRWCCVCDPPEPSMLSSATQSVLWAWIKKMNFWHLIFAALVFDKSDKCEALSKRVVPSNQLAPQRLKLHRLLTKQSHTPIGNEVPRGHTYIQTRIIILLHTTLTPLPCF